MLRLPLGIRGVPLLAVAVIFTQILIRPVVAQTSTSTPAPSAKPYIPLSEQEKLDNDVFAVPSDNTGTSMFDNVTLSATRPTKAGGGGEEAEPIIRKIPAFSSQSRDNTPIISADGSIMFFNSTRKGNRWWARFDTLSNRYDEDIYYSTFISQGTHPAEEIWSEPKNLGPKINTFMDDGVSSISPDGQTIYFVSLKPTWERDGGPYYRANLQGATWQRIQGLGGGITDFFTSRDKRVRFRVYGASISVDGKDFYFATSVHSRTNTMEIWVSHLVNSEWTWPENLGPTINGNTAQGSYAPYIAVDGKTLYFASREAVNGVYPSDDDIFMSVYRDGEWQKPINVGVPISSPGNESFLSVPASGDRLYLSSSRDGADEIFLVSPLPKKLRPLGVIMLSGIITDKVTGKPLEANIAIEDLKTGEVIQNNNSNSLTGKYTVVLQPGHDYGLSISAKDYIFRSDRYTVPASITYKQLERDFQLEKMQAGKAFVVNNVFFDYDSATVKKESYLELDRIVNLMKEHPEAKILISGHTDNIGGDSYNFKLSNRRTTSVKEYIVTKGGIDASRVKTEGFGASKPLGTNETEEGRQKNRRTEFTILNI